MTKSSYKNNLKNILPPLYAFMAIGISALFFIYMGQTNRADVIGRFSIISTGIFLLTHIFSLGNDQAILSTVPNKIILSKIYLDKRLLVPFFSFLASFIVIDTLFKFVLFESYLLNYLTDLNIYKLQYSLIISLTVFMANISKTLASFYIINNYINTANTLYFFKSIGLMFGVAAFIFLDSNKELLIVFLMELTCCMSLILILLFHAIRQRLAWTYHHFQKNFFIAGLNIFGFDSILKQDLIILSFFQGPSEVAKYAVISSVYEGLSQTITTLQQNYSNVLRKKISIKFDPNFKLKNKLQNILSIGFKLSILFIFAAPTFYFIVFSSIEAQIIIIIFILQVALLFGYPAIITFYTRSIQGEPFRLFVVSIFIIITNTFISIILYNIVGIVGVSIGTMLSFLMMRIFIYRHSKILFMKEN